jgi:hypothetical protein
VKKLKKSLSVLLTLLFVAVMFAGFTPVQAATKGASISYAAYEHSPLLAGEKQGFFLSAKGYYNNVQYSVWLNDVNAGTWVNILPYGTTEYNAEQVVKVLPDKVYQAGNYKVSIWVKGAGRDGVNSNKNGSFDSYYVIPFRCAAQDATKWVTSSGDMTFASTDYTVGKPVTLTSIAGIAGMSGSYLYKLHVRDMDGNWTIDKDAFRANATWTPTVAGKYLVDVWAADSKAPAVREVVKLALIDVKEAVATDEKAEAIAAAIKAIDAIPAVDKLTLADEPLVTAAGAAILAAKDKGAVPADITNGLVFKAAYEKMVALKTPAATATGKVTVKDILGMFKGITVTTDLAGAKQFKVEGNTTVAALGKSINLKPAAGATSVKVTIYGDDTTTALATGTVSLTAGTDVNFDLTVAQVTQPTPVDMKATATVKDILGMFKGVTVNATFTGAKKFQVAGNTTIADLGKSINLKPAAGATTVVVTIYGDDTTKALGTGTVDLTKTTAQEITIK